eukprot:2220114-Rhodomonas_salina.3
MVMWVVSDELYSTYETKVATLSLEFFLWVTATIEYSFMVNLLHGSKFIQDPSGDHFADGIETPLLPPLNVHGKGSHSMKRAKSKKTDVIDAGQGGAPAGLPLFRMNERKPVIGDIGAEAMPAISTNSDRARNDKVNVTVLPDSVFLWSRKMQLPAVSNGDRGDYYGNYSRNETRECEPIVRKGWIWIPNTNWTRL